MENATAVQTSKFLDANVLKKCKTLTYNSFENLEERS